MSSDEEWSKSTSRNSRSIPVEDYQHNVVELEDEVNQIIEKRSKVDACLDWFVCCVKGAPPKTTSRWWCPDLKSLEDPNLKGFIEELQHNLNRLVPGYLDPEVPVMKNKGVYKRFSERWPVINPGIKPLQDSIPTTLLDTLCEKRLRAVCGSTQGQAPSSTAANQTFADSCRQLKDLIEGERTSASFVCGGSIPIESAQSDTRSTSGPVSIYWSTGETSAQKLVLPTQDSDPAALEQLVARCDPASFGRGQQDILDPSYRKAGKVDPDQFATSFHPADFGIVESIEKVLLAGVGGKGNGGPRKLHAELYKLNIYSGPSGLFRSHVDTPRSTSQVGSLVVCLPAPFRGGNLFVRHQGREIDFDWASASGSAIQWAAFYSDCEHEIKTITEGHRITLTYNLYLVEPEDLLPPIVDPQSLPLFNCLKSQLSFPGFLDEGGVLGIFCSHAYPHTAKIAPAGFPACLKGSDLVLFSIFRSLGIETQVLPVLEKSGKYIPANPDLGLTGRLKDKNYYLHEYGYGSNPLHAYLAEGKNINPKSTGMMPRTANREDYADIDRRWKLMMLTSCVGSMRAAIKFAQKNNIPYKEDSLYATGGAWIGASVHSYRTTDCGGEDVSMDEVIQEVWPAYYLNGIAWLTDPKHEEMAFSQIAYGNEASIATRYSCAAILAVIPPLEQRTILDQA
ncbi:hypothetical protein BDV25DRAFT_42831 [Aspergillus avenaceus]|uniref:Fe2OG dioxygenase domain-containing protein n=1 Tax=Aspergillus avenaceus TaxID=36643 RepID=A0A5N6TKX2_ASPAV|nr:hypothetical protein BDV25DRAFT_42831 [Aspergillus avenaceus]